MKWLLDEGVPKRLALWLAERGDEVLVVGASQYRSQPDSVLWQVAGREGRFVVTRDRGFACPSVQPAPPGIVVVRAPDTWRGAAVSLLAWDALQRLEPEQLRGHITVISPGQVRQHLLSRLSGVV